MDTEPKTPPLLHKLDALMQKHRGGKDDAGIPILTELDVRKPADDIPVLSNVVHGEVMDFDLLFSPEEILGETPEQPEPSAPAYAPPAYIPPVEPPAARLSAIVEPVQTLEFDYQIDVPMLGGVQVAKLPEVKPAAPKAAAPALPDIAAPVAPEPLSYSAAPEALLPEISFDFGLPEVPPLSAPAAPQALTPPAIAAPAAAPVLSAAPPVLDELDELVVEFAEEPIILQDVASASDEDTLDFDLEPLEITLDDPHPLTQVIAPALEVAAPAPIPAPAPLDDASRIPVLTELALTSVAPISASAPIIEAEAEAPELADAESLQTALLDELRPEVQRLVRTELSRQVATLHQAAIKSTLEALMPQLERMVAEHIAQALDALGQHKQP